MVCNGDGLSAWTRCAFTLTSQVTRLERGEHLQAGGQKAAKHLPAALWGIRPAPELKALLFQLGHDVRLSEVNALHKSQCVTRRCG